MNAIRPSRATESTNWSGTPIDQFIEVKQRERGLRPVGDAAPEVLVRRLYFLLTGLPPSPQDLRKWGSWLRVESDTARQAVVSQLVDELLASDRYGERWGRHWLDVARFLLRESGDAASEYELGETSFGLIALLNDLHKGRDRPRSSCCMAKARKKVTPVILFGAIDASLSLIHARLSASRVAGRVRDYGMVRTPE